MTDQVLPGCITFRWSCERCTDGTVPAPLPAELWLSHPPANPNPVQIGDVVDLAGRRQVLANDDRLYAFFRWAGGTDWTLVERAGHPWPYTPAPGARVGLCNPTGGITHTATVVQVVETVDDHTKVVGRTVTREIVPGGTATLLTDLTAVTSPGGCPTCLGDLSVAEATATSWIEFALAACRECCGRTFLPGPWLPDGQPRPTTPRWTPIGDAA